MPEDTNHLSIDHISGTSQVGFNYYKQFVVKPLCEKQLDVVKKLKVKSLCVKQLSVNAFYMQRTIVK